MNLQPNQILAHYRLEEKIGEGGMDLLFARPGVGRTLAVTMQTEPALSFSAPRQVLDPGLIKPGFLRATDLPDGRWFGIEKGPNEVNSNRVSIVFNWLQDMERRHPRQP